MDDPITERHYPLDARLAAVTAIGSDPQVTITDVRNRAVVQVFARRGQNAAVEKALGITSVPGRAAAGRGFTALPLAPGQWLLVAGEGSEGSFAARLERKLAGLGHVSEQSDGRTVLRLSGPKARQVMEKACRLDLHPSVAGKGMCAQVQMAQVGVTLHQTSDAPEYELLVYPGFGLHFFDFLWHAAAEFGVRAQIEVKTR